MTTEQRNAKYKLTLNANTWTLPKPGRRQMKGRGGTEGE